MHWTQLTRHQGGVVSREQLQSNGYSPGVIGGMIRRGRLEPTGYERVYRAAGSPETADSLRWMAVFATRSPLSYLSAAQAWELPAPKDGKVHVTRFDRRRFDWPEGIRVHRVRIDPTAITEVGGLPVTSRVETLLDCLGSLRLEAARTLADRAKQQHWLSGDDIERRLTNDPGRWGNARLRLLLPCFGDSAHSEAERRLHSALRRAGLTGWHPNMPVLSRGGRYVIDVAFVQQRIAVEIDGYGPHSSREAFQYDRTKSNRLIADGWTVLRFTWIDVVDRPDYVTATIKQILAA